MTGRSERDQATSLDFDEVQYEPGTRPVPLTDAHRAQSAAQGFHYYATTAFCWHTAPSRDEAIRLCLDRTRQYRGKPHPTTGEYVYSVRVDLPQTARYDIEYYTPKDVPLSEKREGFYKTRQKALVCVKEGR